MSPSAATWGMWVIATTWWRSPRKAIFVSTAPAISPPTLASISSKTISGIAVLIGEGTLHREHDPRHFAARGDDAERLERFAGVRAKEKVNALEPARAGLGSGSISISKMD